MTPDYLDDLLTEAKATLIVGPTINGKGHPQARFRLPSGREFRWSWPTGRSDDPRAKLNNRSQLKRFLRGLQ
jgi:hypothetical protein